MLTSQYKSRRAAIEVVEAEEEEEEEEFIRIQRIL